MVKNKKMSKSAIAIIVLSLLLVLSMVMGLTGAWFTDSASGGAESDSLKFGEVALSAPSMTLTVESSETDLSHVVDKDTFTLEGASLSDASDVNVYAAVYTEKDLYKKSGENWVLVGAEEKFEDGVTGIRASFKQGGSAYSFHEGEWTVSYIASNAASKVLVNVAQETIEFDSGNGANNSGLELKIVYKIHVVEIQAKNIASAAALASELQTLAQNYNVVAISAEDCACYNSTASASTGSSTTQA